MKKLLCIMLIACMSTLYMGCGTSKDQSNNNSAETEEKSEQSSQDLKDDRQIINLKEEKSNLTYDNFKNLKLGITYEECKLSLQEANMLVQEGDTKTYTWKMDNNKNISVVVKNGKVVSKAQGLLSDKKYPITKAQYDSLKEGMSYDEIKKIVGDGEFTNSELTSDNKEKSLYAYYNQDYSSAILTVIDGKLYSKSNNNLE